MTSCTELAEVEHRLTQRFGDRHVRSEMTSIIIRFPIRHQYIYHMLLKNNHFG